MAELGLRAPRVSAEVRIDTRASVFVLAVFILALLLRVAGIDVESFWVDEAFSAWASAGSPAEILERNARDIHPPAYYLGLHVWRELISGTDVALRAYSMSWSLLGIGLLMLFTRELFGGRAALVAGLFAAVNPLDIYFAQEARMYSQTTTLALASSFTLWRWCEAARRGESAASWWPWALCYSVIATLTLFTHYVAVTFLVGQGCVAMLLFASRRDRASAIGFALCGLAVGLAFSPWLRYVLGFRDSISSAENLAWMPIPGVVDFFSFLGREYFWGRVPKLHDVWWVPTLLVTLAVLAAPAFRKLRAKTQATDRARWLFLFGHLAAPLAVCGLVCISYQVIYYRPRYVFLLLPYFLMLLAWSCSALDNRKLGGVAVACLALLMASGSWVQQQTPQKRPWRQTAAAWPDRPAPAFYVIQPEYHQLPLRHYLGAGIRTTPSAVLSKLGPLPKGAHIWIASWPENLSTKDTQYRRWLASLGPARELPLSGYYTITQLEPAGSGREVWPKFAAERFRAWYRPFDIAGELAGFSDAAHFSQLEFDGDGAVYRRATGDGWLRLEGIAPGESLVLSVASEDLPELRYYLQRGASPTGLFRVSPAAPEVVPANRPANQWNEQRSELRFRAPAGRESLWLGWKQPLNSQDTQTGTEGLRISWLGVAAPAPERDVATLP